MPFDTRDALLLEALCEKLGVAERLPAARDALLGYLSLVSTWNARVDLTAARSARALVEVLIADACVLSDRALVAEGSTVLDVGTGVGAPILPLCLLRSDLRAVCIEPRRKRMAFLRSVVGQLSVGPLGLVERVELHETRVDPKAPRSPSARPATMACSRATFAPERWLPLALALAPQALVLVAREPLPGSSVSARLLAERRYQLPFSGAERAIGLYGRA